MYRTRGKNSEARKKKLATKQISRFVYASTFSRENFLLFLAPALYHVTKNRFSLNMNLDPMLGPNSATEIGRSISTLDRKGSQLSKNLRHIRLQNSSQILVELLDFLLECQFSVFSKLLCLLH